MIRVRIACYLVFAFVWAGLAQAGELYASGGLGISSGAGEASGRNTLADFEATGDDADAAPMYGAAIGYAFPLDALLPWEWRLWRYEMAFPSWQVRTELEAQFGRDVELTTDGFTDSTPYRSEVSSWSLLTNLWLDWPIYAPVQRFFGRIPVFEPVTVYTGVGIGTARNDLQASDSLVSGSDTSFAFAWQGGVGVNYAVTDHVSLTAGYRYYDPGTVEVDIRDDAGVGRGEFALDLSAHEFTSGVRVEFWRFPFLGRER